MFDLQDVINARRSRRRGRGRKKGNRNSRCSSCGQKSCGCGNVDPIDPNAPFSKEETTIRFRALNDQTFGTEVPKPIDAIEPWPNVTSVRIGIDTLAPARPVVFYAQPEALVTRTEADSPFDSMTATQQVIFDPISSNPDNNYDHQTSWSVQTYDIGDVDDRNAPTTDEALKFSRQTGRNGTPIASYTPFPSYNAAEAVAVLNPGHLVPFYEETDLTTFPTEPPVYAGNIGSNQGQFLKNPAADRMVGLVHFTPAGVTSFQYNWRITMTGEWLIPTDPFDAAPFNSFDIVPKQGVLNRVELLVNAFGDASDDQTIAPNVLARIATNIYQLEPAGLLGGNIESSLGNGNTGVPGLYGTLDANTDNAFPKTIREYQAWTVDDEWTTPDLDGRYLLPQSLQVQDLRNPLISFNSNANLDEERFHIWPQSVGVSKIDISPVSEWRAFVYPTNRNSNTLTRLSGPASLFLNSESDLAAWSDNTGTPLPALLENNLELDFDRIKYPYTYHEPEDWDSAIGGPAAHYKTLLEDTFGWGEEEVQKGMVHVEQPIELIVNWTLLGDAPFSSNTDFLNNGDKDLVIVIPYEVEAKGYPYTDTLALRLQRPGDGPITVPDSWISEGALACFNSLPVEYPNNIGYPSLQPPMPAPAPNMWTLAIPDPPTTDGTAVVTIPAFDVSRFHVRYTGGAADIQKLPIQFPFIHDATAQLTVRSTALKNFQYQNITGAPQAFVLGACNRFTPQANTMFVANATPQDFSLNSNNANGSQYSNDLSFVAMNWPGFSNTAGAMNQVRGARTNLPIVPPIDPITNPNPSNLGNEGWSVGFVEADQATGNFGLPRTTVFGFPGAVEIPDNYDETWTFDISDNHADDYGRSLCIVWTGALNIGNAASSPQWNIEYNTAINVGQEFMVSRLPLNAINQEQNRVYLQVRSAEWSVPGGGLGTGKTKILGIKYLRF